MKRPSSDHLITEPTASRYASTFRLLSPKRKSREIIGSSSASTNPPLSSKAVLSPSIYLKKAFKQIRGPLNRRRYSLSSIKMEQTESSEQSPLNVMEFLIDICPEDFLPKILAFAGPQKTAALSKVNCAWRDVIAEEWTWRVLCEDLYKVCSYSFIVSRLPGSSMLTCSSPLTLSLASHSGHQISQNLYPGKTIT
jgi:hypothetical protein